MNNKFINALNAAGLHTTHAVIADGNMHRFHVKGDRAGSRNGWYIFYNDAVPAGAFGCWKRGISKTWCAKSKAKLSHSERTASAFRMEQAQTTARKAEADQRQSKARFEANVLWEGAAVCFSHPYLENKRVKSYGLRRHGDVLLIPIMDVHGVIHSLQSIYPNGDKRFFSGGKIKGCYCPIQGAGESLIICEGYATGASIHESTGHEIAVAFNAGNLKPVAQAIRAKYPQRTIIIAADNDDHLDKNIGVIKASEAARAINAHIIIPPVSGDFNDYYSGVTQ